MKAPCRKCETCLDIRRRFWRNRCLAEIEFTESQRRRSWFLTLTIAPVHLAGMLSEAGPDPAKLPGVVHKHVVRYVKRLRKGGARYKGDTKWPKERFRYVAIFERGDETDRPHVHMFVHEMGPRPIGNRHLKAAWRSHVDCDLVDASRPGVARYVTEYIGKTLGARPYASLRYGQPE